MTDSLTKIPFGILEGGRKDFLKWLSDQPVTIEVRRSLASTFAQAKSISFSQEELATLQTNLPTFNGGSE
jgi:hypothetical protein